MSKKKFKENLSIYNRLGRSVAKSATGCIIASRYKNEKSQQPSEKIKPSLELTKKLKLTRYKPVLFSVKSSPFPKS